VIATTKPDDAVADTLNVLLYWADAGAFIVTVIDWPARPIVTVGCPPSGVPFRPSVKSEFLYATPGKVKGLPTLVVGVARNVIWNPSPVQSLDADDAEITCTDLDTVQPVAAPVITMVGVPDGVNSTGNVSLNDRMLSIFPQFPLVPVTVAVKAVCTLAGAVVGDIV